MRVLSSLAIKEAYLELLPAFTAKAKREVDTEWLGMVDIMKRVKAGEAADVVIASQKALGELKSLGKVEAVIDLARSGVAVAVKKGARRPDLGSAEAVKRALRAAKSIAYSSGPSGVYLVELFQKWGIADELKPKSTQTPPGTAVGPLVARGEAEIGFQQMSELLPTPGIDIVGPLPAEIQIITTFSGGVHVAAKDAEGARAWMAFLTSPQAAPVLRKHGMEPAK
ncbi:MAG: molybdate transport system substrate-binding protein [Betaproteobacteria bacterium]|jgi:molybdate transport system substrate-binding protein|nr:molybdate transport system substrate-binding protein [Betaproteobacteria bacterium]